MSSNSKGLDLFTASMNLWITFSISPPLYSILKQGSKYPGKHSVPTERTNPSQKPLEPKSQVSKSFFIKNKMSFLPFYLLKFHNFVPNDYSLTHSYEYRCWSSGEHWWPILTTTSARDRVLTSANLEASPSISLLIFQESQSEESPQPVILIMTERSARIFIRLGMYFF